jgi:hypothetical protein
MAYKTGVSSTVTELVTALKSFAVEQGFASGPIWSVASGNTTDQGASVSYLAKGGNFFHFAWNDTTLGFDIATGSNGAGLPYQQPGALGATESLTSPTCMFVSPIQGPHVGYHFFSDGQTIHVAVELVTNVFNHFSFGMINKAGNWDNGAYVEGTRWNPIDFGQGRLQPFDSPYHSRIFDGMTGYAGRSYTAFGRNWSTYGLMRAQYNGRVATVTEASPGNGPAVFNANTWSHLGWGLDLIQDSPNSFNSRAVLVPIEVALASERAATPANFLQLGQIPTAAAINMAFINPKDIVNNDWMVFPLSQKNGPGIIYVNSLNNGIAYRK